MERCCIWCLPQTLHECSALSMIELGTVSRTLICSATEWNRS